MTKSLILLSLVPLAIAGCTSVNPDPAFQDVDKTVKARTGENVHWPRDDSQRGEFFAGTIYPNKENGKIYVAMGKYTPMLFEAEGWSLKENPVKPLTTVQKTVTLTADRTASPPEIEKSLASTLAKPRASSIALWLCSMWPYHSGGTRCMPHLR